MKRWLACTALAVGVTGALTVPAAADPPSSAEFPVPITCDGTTYVVGFLPGQGDFTPALVTTSNQVVVPFEFELTFTDLTTGESETDTVQKGPGTNPNAVNCTIDFTSIDPDTGHEFNIAGTVTAMIAPPR